MSTGRRSPAPAPAAWPPWTPSASSSRPDRLQLWALPGSSAPLLGSHTISEKRHGTRLSSHGQAPDGREQRFPRQQQNEAPLPAEPAIPPVLAREREPLGAPAPQQ